jgi:hypothetical protein
MAKKNKKDLTTTGQYDKIFKENSDEIHLAIINRFFQSSIGKAQTEDVPQSDLQYTIERKADFLKKILPHDDSPPYCLHIEIQASNDLNMIWRMCIYRSLISQKYQFRSVQFVIYIGNEPLTMKSMVSEEKLVFSYEIIDIRRYNYEEFLNANTPEEVILAILADFHGENPTTVIERILLRLKELTFTELAFGKYATQLEVLSELRELKQITKTQINNMPVVLDYTSTTAFEKGEAKGEIKAKKDASFGMFAEGLTIEAIVRITKLPKETIEVWKKEWEINH